MNPKESTCFANPIVECGYGYDMIDNGSTYWFASAGSDGGLYYWEIQYLANGSSYSSLGVRPVIILRKYRPIYFNNIIKTKNLEETLDFLIIIFDILFKIKINWFFI